MPRANGVIHDDLPDEFGARARIFRKRAGLSTIEAAYRIRDCLPESEWKSYQAIHRLETGDSNEADTSPAFLAALAKVYGVPLAELSSLAADSRQRLLSLFLDETLGSKKRGNSTPRNRKPYRPSRPGSTRIGHTDQAA